MSKKFLSTINLPQGATLPATGISGDTFYNTTDQQLYIHDGTSWVASGSAGTDISLASNVIGLQVFS